MKQSVAILAALLFSASIHAERADPEVEVKGGRLMGKSVDGLSIFHDIPYASAPIGEYRWTPPRPTEPWSGTRDAREFGPYCPQNLKPGYSNEALAEYPMSEDCLRLNVWTPSATPDVKLPVMVWILPGSFRRGATALPRYDGAALAQQGVVVVTFEYRMGILGQFAHPALSAQRSFAPAGNYNLMDQIAALQWVQGNIDVFGGDSDKVTIFGMSAGGVSVNYLMAMPAAHGLFHRAISQSSGIRVSNPRRIDSDVPGAPSLHAAGIAMAEHFGIEEENAAQGLRQLSVEQILEYQGNPRLFSPGSLNPVVDGKLVRDSVGQVFKDGRQHAVPYIAGATSWEGSLVSFMQSADRLLPIFGLDRQQAEVLYAGMNEAELINAIETDFFFGSQRYLVQRHAEAGAPAWLYYWSRVLEAHVNELPGAGHGAETPYVFGTLSSLAPPTLMPAWGGTVSDSDLKYSELASATWVEFAKSGDPNGEGLPQWPAWKPGQGVLMEFGQDAPAQRSGFREQRLKHFDTLFDQGKL